MGSLGGERAVSEVMGAILVFGILVTALGVYQAVVVPDVNEEVEFKHNAEVRGDMQDLWTAMVETGRTGERNTVQLTTGADYPTRVFTINPPPISGRLTTTAVHSEAVVVGGATATNSEAADFWDESSNRKFSTRFVEYAPEYNYYTNAPKTIFEPTVLFSEDRGGTVVDSPQRLVDGHTVNLILVDGQYAKSTDRKLSLDTVPISASTQSVEIENLPGGPITLTVKTGLPKEKWKNHAAKYDHVAVSDYDTTGSQPRVSIELTDSAYTLNVAKIGIDQADTTSAAYIENTGDRERTINPGETTEISPRVLDEFGNPVEGVTVHSDFAGDRTTDEDGIASFEYASSPGRHQPNVWFDDGGSKEERVRYTVDVSSPSTSEEHSNLVNPSNGLVLRSATIDDSDSSSVTMGFENTRDTQIAVDEVRINYYFVGPPGAGGSINARCSPDKGTSDRVNGDMIIGDTFQGTNGFTADSKDDIDFSVAFEDSANNCSFSIEETDYFILTFIFGDGSSRIYFVAPG